MLPVRYNGTLLVTLSDGTVETFRDETWAHKKRWANLRRWTHSMEKQWDDSLVVTRHVQEFDMYGARHEREANVRDEWTEVVGHYPPGTWSKARFKG